MACRTWPDWCHCFSPTRSCVLERPDNYGRLKPMAANIDQMLIVFACAPTPQPNLIDRYLVAAELLRVRPILVLNKADLLDRENRQSIDPLLQHYQDLGYDTVSVISSRHQAAELANLPELIQGRTSIVVGQSGVGKSSLINTLMPETKLRGWPFISALRGRNAYDRQSHLIPRI